MSDPAASLADLVAAWRVAGVDTASIEVKAPAQQLSKSMVETLSAFANGDGGLVILGLDETKGFTPAAGFHAERIREALAGACADRLQPPLRPVIAIEAFEDALVVVARIEPLRPHDKPCYVKDRGLYQGSRAPQFPYGCHHRGGFPPRCPRLPAAGRARGRHQRPHAP
jgi:ATP-dependent DNA helicase RecG